MSGPLPAHLGSHFSVADAVCAGVVPSRLRRTDLRAPFPGVRATTAASTLPFITADRLGRERGPHEREHLLRACEYRPRMTEHEFFSHVTAAVAYGCPLPLSAVRGRPLDSAVLAPRRLPRTAGVRGHQAVPTLTRVRRDPWTGLTLADPATTWAMLGGVLTDLFDLVAAGDAFVREWRVGRPLTTIEHLTAATDAGRRVGVGRLREALPLIRTRSASRTETWCRLTLCAAGLPEPELNLDVVVNGVRIACVDLAYPRHRVAIEYEGDHHLMDAEQWARDIERYDALRDAGWHVIRVTRVDLFRHPERIVARARAALAARA